MADESYDLKQPESVAAVLKVFALLQALSENDETGISDLSVRLAMPWRSRSRSSCWFRSLPAVAADFVGGPGGVMAMPATIRPGSLCRQDRFGDLGV